MEIPIEPMSPPKEACQGVTGRRAIKAEALKGAKHAEELERLQTLGSRGPCAFGCFVSQQATAAKMPRGFVCCGCEGSTAEYMRDDRPITPYMET